MKHILSFAIAFAASTYAAFEVSPENVRTVYLTQMNHLDVGFNHGEYSSATNSAACIDPPYTTDCGFGFSVINTYFDHFFPQAIATAQELRKLGGRERLVYTTHSWLVSLYVDCPASLYQALHCPTPAQVQEFEDAVRRGDIAWHAVPMNVQSELMDRTAFESGIELTHRLDDRFGRNRSAVMSQRDVPGLTQAVISPLYHNGVRAISIGANQASSPVDVPNAFWWHTPDYAAGDSIGILVFYHPNGYGGLNVSDCVILPAKGGDYAALCMAFKGDNRGPPNVTEVQENFEFVASQFPNAEIRAATFDDFLDGLDDFKLWILDAIHNEMGDTWIYGCPSDPLKLAQMRAVARVQAKCVESKKCRFDDPTFANFSRIFYKVYEHTWGMDVKNFLDDWSDWSNEDFQRMLNTTNYTRMTDSWDEQRAYISYAVTALSANASFAPLIKEINAELAALNPTLPDLTGYELVNATSQIFECGRFSIGFNATTGAINHLQDTKTKRNWAAPANPLAEFVYQTYSAADFDRFLSQYLNCPPSECYWGPLDLGKPGLSSAAPAHITQLPSLNKMYRRQQANGTLFALQLALPTYLSAQYGAPRDVWLLLAVQHASIEITLLWFNKTATRLPESLWLTFNPILDRSPDRWVYAWRVFKLGQSISPINVANNGSKHLHGFDSGVAYNPDGRENYGPPLFIDSVDAGVVAPGGDQLLNFTNAEPDMNRGMSFNLFNNLYGTNYIMWYPFHPEDSSSQFRFRLRFDKTS
eukprot:TRINITY_DN22658_c0_g1_i1.p1 TRINITY_DN22658_c0_g1~~TRINITY_DN22658_c0_g1_i1.p1  ORF type:complete len:757 (+),score=184.44 TRINITY_DN22658_c0_g1_i1:92-2362(+)